MMAKTLYECTQHYAQRPENLPLKPNSIAITQGMRRFFKSDPLPEKSLCLAIHATPTMHRLLITMVD